MTETTSTPSPSLPRVRRRPGWGLVLLLVAVIAAGAVWSLLDVWWSPVPLLSLLGGLLGLAAGRRRSWLVAPLAGLGLGIVLWGAELLALPSAPLARLAVIIGATEGVSGPAIEGVTLLLFGVAVALGAATVRGLARLVAEARGSRPAAAPASPR